MGEGLSPLNPHVQSFLDGSRDYLRQWSGDPVHAQHMGVHALASLRHEQAAAMAYLDVFWLCAILTAVLVFSVLLMKRSVAEKGEHIAAE
jgi:DHA2 family multidrug resistance protein